MANSVRRNPESGRNAWQFSNSNKAGPAKMPKLSFAANTAAEIKPGKLESRTAKMDADKRSIDFYSFRTSTGTMPARAGVTPQMAKMVMRHSDVRTTMRHYTDLRLVDAANAVGKLPRLGGTPTQPETLRATGTTCKATFPMGAPVGLVGPHNGAFRVNPGHSSAGKMPAQTTPQSDAQVLEMAGGCESVQDAARSDSKQRARRIELLTFSLGS